MKSFEGKVAAITGAASGLGRADHGHVNLVINNAGVAVAAPAETPGIEDFDWLMGINFWGVVHGTQERQKLPQAAQA